jgi:hypothetical protein
MVLVSNDIKKLVALARCTHDRSCACGLINGRGGIIGFDVSADHPAPKDWKKPTREEIENVQQGN